jgi:predicted dehydrogenase
VAELEDFIEAVRGGSEPVSDPRMAVDVIRMIEAAEASLADDGARVSLGEATVGARR